MSDPSEKLPGVDPILAFLVARVEEDRESGKITLFLSGSIITGTIIGAAESALARDPPDRPCPRLD